MKAVPVQYKVQSAMQAHNSKCNAYPKPIRTPRSSREVPVVGVEVAHPLLVLLREVNVHALGRVAVARAVLPRDAEEVDDVRDEGERDERDADAVARDVLGRVLGEEREHGDDAADCPGEKVRTRKGRRVGWGQR